MQKDLQKSFNAQQTRFFETVLPLLNRVEEPRKQSVSQGSNSVTSIVDHSTKSTRRKIRASAILKGENLVAKDLTKNELTISSENEKAESTPEI